MNIEELVKKATELASTYAPAAWEKVLFIVQVNALSTLIPTVVVLAAALVYIYKFKTKYLPEAQAWLRENDYKRLEYAPFFFPRAIFLGIAGVAAFVCTIMLLRVWLWVALIYPDLYIAYQTLNKVI